MGIWGSYGSLPEQLNNPCDVAVDGPLAYVADYGNNAIKLFTIGGEYVTSWSCPSPGKIDIDGEHVYVTSKGTDLRVYDKNGNVQWRSPQGILGTAQGVMVRSNLLYVAGTTSHVLFGPIYRTLGAATFNNVPVPCVTNVSQRRGLAILDCDYVIADRDDSTVTVYAAAFVVGTNFTASLTNFIPMRTFVEGTSTNIGPGQATGVGHRLSWNMASDGATTALRDYGTIQVAVMAQDDRGLMDLHFLKIPAMYGKPALTINQTPLQQTDFLPLWFWLLSSGDAALNTTTGVVRGIGGTYNGQILASGTNTTIAGRSFLYERLHVREATTNEIRNAQEGTTPGTVLQWTPRRQPPPRNYKVNSIGFVTSPTNGGWVVPLP